MSRSNPIWVRVYYRYQIKDAVIGLTGELPNTDLQALGLDFDDKLPLEELKTHIENYICFVKHNLGVDLGRAYIYETSPNKYYVWFLESRLQFRCKCPTIINLAGIRGLQADDNYVMWLQKKNNCVMRTTKKTFYKQNPKLVSIVGETKEIPLEQQDWKMKFLEMVKC